MDAIANIIANHTLLQREKIALLELERDAYIAEGISARELLARYQDIQSLIGATLKDKNLDDNIKYELLNCYPSADLIKYYESYFDADIKMYPDSIIWCLIANYKDKRPQSLLEVVARVAVRSPLCLKQFFHRDYRDADVVEKVFRDYISFADGYVTLERLKEIREAVGLDITIDNMRSERNARESRIRCIEEELDKSDYWSL